MVRRSSGLFRIWAALLVAWALMGAGRSLPAQVAAEPCPPENTDRNTFIPTDQVVLEAESTSGAVGDVVAVSLLLRVHIETPRWTDMFLAVCHDPGVLEMVGKPSYSDAFVALTGGIYFWPVVDGAGPIYQEGDGFLLSIDLEPNAYEARFPSDEPLEMMTIYYRVKGTPGDTGQVSFCDGELVRGEIILCNFNDLYGYGSDYPATPYQHYLPTTIPGTVTVLEGPATHPDRPPEPPEAKVYPELPSPEEINFRVEIESVTTHPGATEVPVDVYVSADVEYSCLVLPIDFDERYLRLARAEDHFLTGLVLVDNFYEKPGAAADEGHAIIYSGLGVNSWRLAEEGQRVHAATLYFDVLESASEIESTSLSVTKVMDHRGLQYAPWIGVHYQSGVGINDPPIRAEIPPIEIKDGLLALSLPQSLFIRGDSNGDRTLDLSDAVTTLSYLFLGSEDLGCLDSADSNDDGTIDISDPVSALGFLFLGGEALPEPSGSPGEDTTPDGLDCLNSY